ncbi:MAG: hypothetical protein AABW80_01115 [Nanoarchaeota archaeon]
MNEEKKSWSDYEQNDKDREAQKQLEFHLKYAMIVMPNLLALPRINLPKLDIFVRPIFFPFLILNEIDREGTILIEYSQGEDELCRFELAHEIGHFFHMNIANAHPPERKGRITERKYRIHNFYEFGAEMFALRYIEHLGNLERYLQIDEESHTKNSRPGSSPDVYRKTSLFYLSLSLAERNGITRWAITEDYEGYKKDMGKHPLAKQIRDIVND